MGDKSELLLEKSYSDFLLYAMFMDPIMLFSF